jgi:hypothetical protein
MKETTMNAKKMLLGALALAALTATGLGAASAQPRHVDRDIRVERHVTVERDFRSPAMRRTVDRADVYRTLRMHRFIGIGQPHFLRGQYVVRSQDRFGRLVLVRIDPWTGRFLGVIRV